MCPPPLSLNAFLFHSRQMPRGENYTDYFPPETPPRDAWGLPLEEPGLQCKPTTSKAFGREDPAPWPLGPQEVAFLRHMTAPSHPDVHLSARPPVCPWPQASKVSPEAVTVPGTPWHEHLRDGLCGVSWPQSRACSHPACPPRPLPL